MPKPKSAATARLRCAWLATLLLLCVPGAAFGKGPLLLEVQPLLGSGTPAVDGWMSVHVRVDNRAGETVRGNLSVEAELAWARLGTGPRNTTQVPFSVAARSQVSVKVAQRTVSMRPSNASTAASISP